MAMAPPDAEIERVELAPAAALFKSLGHPARLMIVRQLAAGEAELAEMFTEAEAVLAATGNAVALSPVWGTGGSLPAAHHSTADF